MKPHCLGSHMLSIGKVLRGHLRVCHRHLAHLRSHGVGVGKGRTAVGLMGGVGEMRERSSLVVAMELRSHVGSASGLVGRRTEVGAWRVGHLSLVARLGISTSTATLMVITATSWTVSNVITHVTMGRLGRFASKVARLGSGYKGGCLRAHLSLLFFGKQNVSIFVDR